MISGISYFVLVAYVGVLFACAVWARKKNEEGLLGHFLASKKLGPFLFIITFVGTTFSTASVVGIPGFAYAHGIGSYVFAFAGMSLLGIVGWLYGSKLVALHREYGTYSPIQVMSNRYGSERLGGIVASVTFVFVMAHLAVQLVGVGRLIGAFTGDVVAVPIISFLFLVIVLLYSFVSGARGVAVTDLIQTGLIVIGLIWLGSAVLGEVGGVSSLIDGVRAVEPSLLSLPGPKGALTGLALFSMIALLASASISQPRFSMRLLMTTERSRFKWIAISIVAISAILFAFTLVIGLAGRVWFPDLSSGDDVIGSVLRRLSDGSGLLVVLFLLGVVSAAMSTMDSQLLAISGILTRDIMKPLVGQDWEEARELRISKRLAIVVAVFAYVISLRPPALILDMAFLALAGGLQLVPTYIGQFFQRRSSIAATTSIIGGLTTLILVRSFVPRGWLHGLDPGIVGFLVASLLLVVMTVLRTEKRNKADADSSKDLQTARSERPPPSTNIRYDGNEAGP